jgi:hypothetical protein
MLLVRSSGTIYGGAGDQFSIDGSGNTVTNGQDSTTDVVGDNNTLSYIAPGSTIDTSADATGNVFDVSSGTIYGEANDQFSIYGSGNTVTNGQGSTTDVVGDNNTVDISNATIDLAGNDNVAIVGSNDDIVGAAGDTFTITGGNDLVDASDSDIYFDGEDGGDTVSGSGNTGSGWSGNYGSGTYGDGGYGTGYAGFTSWKGKSPAASVASRYAGTSGTVYENAAWADKTLTWSFATPAAGTGALLSNAISDPSQQAAVEQAFQTWAQASGLNIEEVAAGKPADIEVGFGDLDTATTNEIGLTQYHSTNGDMTGALVELEDPSQSPLTTNSDGQLVYANTEATFEQVALHEIGHALGLADSDQAGSIMNYLLDDTNTSLGSTDLAGISKLYGYGSNSETSSLSEADVSSRQLSQLVQAMATFGSEGMGETSVATADLDLYKPQLAVAFHVQAA